MPYVTPTERMWSEGGLRRGLLMGIEMSLDLKFGAEGLKLLPEIRQIHDHEMLQRVLEVIKTAASPEDLRRVWSQG